MSINLVLPTLEPTATHATVDHVYKQPGDLIDAGEALAVVVTDRFEWDVPATSSGTIVALLADVGSTIAIGAPLVTIATDAAHAIELPDDHSSDRAAARAPRITPLARKIAAAHQLDLVEFTGSGRGGRITQADVRAWIGGTREHETRDARRETRATGHTAAGDVDHRLHDTPRTTHDAPHAMHHVIPYALTAIEVDLIDVERLIERDAVRLRKRGIVVTPLVYVAAATVAALGQHRRINSVWSDDGIIVRGRVQLGVIAAGDARVIADAADLSVQGLANALANGTTDREPTFTIAHSQTRWGHDLIRSSHTACLTIGAIEQRPCVVARDGHDVIAVRPLAIVTLAYDARVIDQTAADAFLRTLKQRVEQWSSLC